MNILFVVDEFPFPPRNGVTLPVANFIKLFAKKGFRVDLLLLGISDAEDHQNIELAHMVTEVVRIPLKRSERVFGLFLELIGKKALFEAWSVKRMPSGGRLLAHYDLVWASPIRSYALWLRLKSMLGTEANRVVAAINDSYTLTLMELSKRKETAFKRWGYICRASAMRGIERRLLAKADLVGVQSKREIDFFRLDFPLGQRPEVIELKNGVAPNLFKARDAVVYDLLFVGSLDDFYRPTLDWFVREVYSKMEIPRPSFAIIGAGATDEDIKKFADFSIEYFPFVEDIYHFYLTSRILVAPIFKGYGTINKVIEAMAAGCVVVGDKTAFNGLENFVPNRDALVAESSSEFLDCITEMLADSSRAEVMGKNARKLMHKDFSWDNRIDIVLSRLELL
ncbi:MAG: glycosyltransferase family 4 protein [Polaromonas sp.]